jgi:hypothetical protein
MRAAYCGVSRLVAWKGLAGRSALLLVALLAGLPEHGGAQSNQFGGQDRADAAQQMIVLGVQQGISSLPPMSGQAFSYEFDPASDTYVRSKQLGPTAFRSPQTVGAGKFSVRLATSYFALNDSLGPVPYRIEYDQPLPGQTQPLQYVAKFGLNASAKVTVVDLAANYGVTNRFEVLVNFPIVIVDAQASQVFSSTRTGLGLPLNQVKVAGPPIVNNDVAGALQKFDEAIKPGGPLVFRTFTFSESDVAFNEGTHAGLGRIDVGAKGVLYSDKRMQLAFNPEFFCPSPNEAEFAGSDSAAILPRLVAAFSVADRLKLHVDAGYNWDFHYNQLSAVVWDFGASVPGTLATFDFGVGGSKFNQGITWTPQMATSAPTLKFPASTATALANNTLGDNFVDFLGGFKVRVMENSAVSGTVSVPLNNEGFRPAAVGTLAAEYYF